MRPRLDPPTRSSPSRLPSVRLRSLGTVLGVGLLVQSVLTAGDVPARRFDLPGGDAAQTLKHFAAQAGAQILFSSADVTGVLTNPVQGDFAPLVAIERMLQGTSLRAREDAALRAIAVIRFVPTPRDPPPDARTGAPSDLPRYPLSTNTPYAMKKAPLIALIAAWLAAAPNSDAQSSSARSPDEAIELTPFQVAANRDYYGSNSVSATRVNVELKNIPSPVQVLTSGLLQDIAAFNLEDSIRFASSVFYNDQFYRGETYFVRGQGGSFFKNGFAQNGFTDNANIEQIEVAKGPNSILYGLVGPGGVVNMVTKKPLFTPRASIDAAYGSYGLKRATLDTTGPIGPGRRVAYRVVSSILNRRFIEDFAMVDRVLVAPSLTWRVTDRIQVHAEYELLKNKNIPNNGIPITYSSLEFRTANPSIFVLNPNRQVGGRTFSLQGPYGFYDAEQRIGQADLTYKVFDWASYRFTYHNFDRDDYSIARRGDSWRPWSGLNLTAQETYVKQDDWAYKNEFLFDFQLAGTEHQLMAAQETTRRRRHDLVRANNTGVGLTLNNRPFPLPPPQTTLYHPTTGLPFTPATGTPSDEDYSLGNLADYRTTSLNRMATLGVDSVYLLDMVSAMDGRLRLLLAGRWDEAVGDLTRRSEKINQFTYQVGGLYRITSRLGFFALHSTSFTPNSLRDPSGVLLPPEEGRGFDVGFKSDGLADGRLSGTLSLFRLERQNIARTFRIIDPLNPQIIGPLTNQSSGLERVQGVDFDLVLKLRSNWQAVLNCSFLDSEVLSNGQNPTVVGMQVVNAPRLSWSAFSNYRFESGPLRDLSVGGGLNHYDSARLEPLPQRILWQSGSYTLVGLFLKYDFTLFGRRAFAQFNADNLFDVIAQRQQNTFLEPRTLKLSIRYSF